MNIVNIDSQVAGRHGVSSRSPAAWPGRRAGRSVRAAGAITLLMILVVAEGTRAQTPRAQALTLDQAVQIALERNRDVRAARFALQEAEGVASEAWGGVYPKLDFTMGYTRNVAPDVSFLPARLFDPNAAEGEFLQVRFGADNVWTSQFYLEQPLFQPQVFVGVAAAARYRDLQEETLRGQRQEVVTRVRLAYLDLLLARERVRLTESSVRRVRGSLEETRALERAGLATEYDVLRLEVELANLETGLRRARSAESRARRDLAVELALEPETPLELSGTLSTLNPGDPESNSAEDRALLDFGGPEGAVAMDATAMFNEARTRRSDVRQAALNVDLRRTDVRAERADYFPRLALFGIYNINAQQNGSPQFFADSGQRAYARRVGINVTIPLFTGFQREARIGQKRAAVRQAEIRAELTRERAEAEIHDLLDSVEETSARVEAQRRAMALAQRGFEIASAQYREGMASQIELTDAEVALRESEFNYAEAVYDYLAERARLDRARGSVPGVDAARMR